MNLYDRQLDVVKEIYNDKVLLNLPTGFGKTIIGLYIASKFVNESVLILIPRRIIYNQWMELIKTYNLTNINLQSTMTYNNYLKTNKGVQIYTAVIVDEVHLFPEMIFTKILPRLRYKFLLALSASPTDNDYYTFEQAEKDKFHFNQYIIRPDWKYFTVQKVFLKYQPLIYHRFVPDKGGGRKWKLDYFKILESLTMNEDRLNQIAGIIEQERLYGDRILVLCKNIATIQYLSSKIKSDYICGKKGTYNDEMIILGTYDKAGVGFDDKTFKTLILLDNIKNVIQSKGRMRNDNFKIIDIVDDHFLFLNHWYERAKCYEERGGEIL
jgi:superfamily II DNA or RNA helicase